MAAGASSLALGAVAASRNIGSVCGAANADGRVSPNGGVTVSVSSGPQAANGQGCLSRDYGMGTWRGKDLAALVPARGRLGGKDRRCGAMAPTE